MFKKHIYFFIGTTAEFIKLSPIFKELQQRKIPFKLITSGQNHINFDSLSGYIGNFKPDIAFKEKVNKSSIIYFLIWATRIFFKSLISLRKEFKGKDKKNTYFIIFGDPVSTTIGAIIAKIYGLTLIHIESGDLSTNLMEPFPEEICRNINIRLADILFPPNSWAENNLKHIKKIKINTQYNTLLEVFWWVMNNKRSTSYKVPSKKYYILILHRQEHILFKKNWSKDILEFVINNANQNLDCLLFNHPLTVEIIKSLEVNTSIPKNKIKITPLLPYPDFLTLLEHAEFIATDGATNQLEAYLMGKPCLILRDYTEQFEGLEKNVVLCKSNKEIIKNFLLHYKNYQSKPIHSEVSPSKIIVDYLLNR